MMPKGKVLPTICENIYYSMFKTQTHDWFAISFQGRQHELPRGRIVESLSDSIIIDRKKNQE